MTKISFHHPGGDVDVIDVDAGTSLMRAAVSTGVKGIVGECGGQAMCATCHVYVRADYLDQLPPMSEDEDEMLDCTSSERDHNRSRLGCQIETTHELIELEVDLPMTQL